MDTNLIFESKCISFLSYLFSVVGIFILIKQTNLSWKRKNTRISETTSIPLSSNSSSKNKQPLQLHTACSILRQNLYYVENETSFRNYINKKNLFIFYFDLWSKIKEHHFIFNQLKYICFIHLVYLVRECIWQWLDKWKNRTYTWHSFEYLFNQC